MQDPEAADGGTRPLFPEANNALGGEPSACRRQCAGNPVHWRPFGDEAFAFAAARDVPGFLSVGCAACHWCHVMIRTLRMWRRNTKSQVRGTISVCIGSAMTVV